MKGEALVGVLALSERTIRRWWNEYQFGGLATFLDGRAVGSSLAEESATYEANDAVDLIEFLNSLPLSNDYYEWRLAMQSALSCYLRGVTQVDIVVYDLEAPDHDELASSVRNDNAADPKLDITIGNEVPLGTIRLHTSTGQSFDVALAQLDDLNLFLTFLFSDALDRMRTDDLPQLPDPQLLLTAPLAASLSPRERDVLVRRLSGHSYSDTAGQLSVSEETVRKCVKAIYRKTGTSSLGELFVRYFASAFDSTTPDAQ